MTTPLKAIILFSEKEQKNKLSSPFLCLRSERLDLAFSVVLSITDFLSLGYTKVFDKNNINKKQLIWDL